MAVRAALSELARTRKEPTKVTGGDTSRLAPMMRCIMQTRLDKWDRRMLELASVIADWSKDPSTKVGAVITDIRHRIVSTGFNGIPRGVRDEQSILDDRDTKLSLTIHAEENAILFATRALDGCTIYVSFPPCARCAAKIVQTGIHRVVSKKPSIEFLSRWSEQLDLAYSLYEQAGIVVDFE